MDKYEYRLKTEHIKKLVLKKDMVTAMKICDTIDWNRVKDVKILTMVSEIYEANGRYEEAIDALLQAYEYAPIGRRIVYRLTELALDCGNYKDAESYFQEFVHLAPNDLSGIILKYKLAKAKGVSTYELIKILEEYKEQDFDEKWAYELAELYHKAGDIEACVKLCNEIILWFSLGKYVEKAMKLKTLYEPMPESQDPKSISSLYTDGADGDLDSSSDNKKVLRDEDEESICTVDKSSSKFEIKEYVDSDLDTNLGEIPEEYDEIIEKSKVTFAQILTAGNDSSADDIKRKMESEIRLIKEDFESVPTQINKDEIGESKSELGASEEKSVSESKEVEEESKIQLEKLEERSECASGEIKIESENKLEGLKEGLETKLEERKEESVSPLEEITERLVDAPKIKNMEPMDQVESLIVEAKEEPVSISANEKDLNSDNTQEILERLVQEELKKGVEESLDTSNPLEDNIHDDSISEILNSPVLEETQVTKDDNVPKDTIWHFAVKSEDRESGFRFAVDKLKEISKDGKDRPSVVAKTTGEKLNKRGIIKSMDKLLGKVLIVEKAGTMSDEILEEFNLVLEKNDLSMIVIFIDSSKEIDRIFNKYNNLSQRFDAVLSIKDYSADELVEYATRLADDHDCAIDDMAILALYAKIEQILELQDGLQKKRVEEVMKHAIDKASKKSVGRAIKGLFVIKYDEAGRLLIKEQDFK